MVVVKMSGYQWETVPEIHDSNLGPGNRLPRELSGFPQFIQEYC
jgi:hypothetical protein